ncbi:peptide chain release factor N(5)-glutamine methyltransferase [Roseibium sp.]|uniref:peptide chain release factor N(5)-glutamine methyltransferase n=1 Tax=Roseibium sp. TaxID=1936156 RepID=UPI003A9775DA
MRVGDLYRKVRDRFRHQGLSTPDLDARLLVSAALGLTPSEMLLHESDDASDAAVARIDEFSKQRLAGKPVGRILGCRDFWGLEFKLNEATLEPRPDTETLVEAVLARTPLDHAITFADIGTGSGAIAISILTELSRTQCIAIDVSERALDCAVANAKQHGVQDRFWPVRGNYCGPLAVGFDWIVSNPPYIRTEVVRELDREVREHDPDLALDGGPDGLDAYRTIVAQAAEILTEKGRIALEIGFDQAADVSRLLQLHGFFETEIIQDLAGMDRVLVARRG